jgi:phospholipid N-methyltransferase
MIKEQDAVKLMTIHASKGLEFDYVFITGLEENLFPHNRLNENNDNDTEEERRLFYVALTRARKKLFLTYAGMRTIFGSKQMNIPSEFMIEMDEDLIQAEERTGSRKGALRRFILINMHYAKKSLGQNFLKSKEALHKIMDAGDVVANDIVLEIGPGKGALTDMLLTSAGKVIAVEKDQSLVSLLKEKYVSQIEAGKLDIKEGDILEFDPTVLKFYEFPYKLIANIPYYITGAVIQKFLTAEYQPERMVLLVQKEVAQRIVAKRWQRKYFIDERSSLW